MKQPTGGIICKPVLGQRVAIKMTILPKMLYLLRFLPLPIPIPTLHQVQAELGRFVWEGKLPRVSRNILSRSHLTGGLGLLTFLFTSKSAA